jgi:hypothetical protein
MLNSYNTPEEREDFLSRETSLGDQENILP